MKVVAFYTRLASHGPVYHQKSSVFCHVVVELASPMVVSLTSTLNGRSMAYNGQEITFTCITRGSLIISWSSDDYIGRGLQLEFISVDQTQSSIQSTVNSNTIATLVNVHVENGIVILESTLRIIVSSQFSSSSINCHHIGSGRMNSSTIQVSGEQKYYHLVIILCLIISACWIG